MRDKSKLTALILAILAVIAIISSIITSNIKENKDKEILIVTNPSNFYTVNSCLYRTITHISSQDYDNLLLLLNDNYKIENKITKDNVLSVFPKVNSSSTFVSEKMYYQELNSNIIKYYVMGYIDENRIYDGEDLENIEKKYTYFIVYLDSKNEIFSVEPYNGEIFNKEGLDEK